MQSQRHPVGGADGAAKRERITTGSPGGNTLPFYGFGGRDMQTFGTKMSCAIPTDAAVWQIVDFTGGKPSFCQTEMRTVTII